MFGWIQKQYDQSLRLSLNAPDAAAVVASGTYDAGNIPVNGALVTTDKVTVPTPQTLDFISAGDDTGVLFFVEGAVDGSPVSEYLAGANAATATTVELYEEVLRITPTVANVAATVSVGISGNATAVCAVQAGTAGTLLLLNGTDVSGVYLNTAKPSYIRLTCAADETANTFTVTGYDISGKKYVYPLAGVNATSALFEIPFSIIYSVTCSVTCSGNVSLGTSNQTATPWCPVDDARDDSLIGINTFVEVGATYTYHVEWTFQDIKGSSQTSSVIPIAIVPDLNIPVGSTVTKTSQVAPSLKGCRAVIDSYTDGALFFFLNQSNKRSTVGG